MSKRSRANVEEERAIKSEAVKERNELHNIIFDKNQEIHKLECRLDSCLYAMILMQAQIRALVKEQSVNEVRLAV